MLNNIIHTKNPTAKEYLDYIINDMQLFVSSISDSKFGYLYLNEQKYHKMDGINSPDLSRFHDHLKKEDLITAIDEYIMIFDIKKYKGAISFDIDQGSMCLKYNGVVLNKVKTQGGFKDIFLMEYPKYINILTEKKNPTREFLFRNKIKKDALEKELDVFRKHWFAIPEHQMSWSVNQLENNS